jgi:F-box domain
MAMIWIVCSPLLSFHPQEPVLISYLDKATAMATSSIQYPNQIDHLSNLPDALLLTILSFLPTHIAARTSLLCRRFRHLWESSPSLHFSVLYLRDPVYDNFVAMADRALLCRNPSCLLFSLRLDLCILCAFDPIASASFVSSLFAKASSLRVRHITIRGCWSLHTHILPIIFSTHTLRSLSVDCLQPQPTLLGQFDFPDGNSFTCLKCLSLGLRNVNPIKFERFISELSSLEKLCLKVHDVPGISISSNTVRELDLILSGTRNLDTVALSLPSLDSLLLSYIGEFGEHLRHVHGKIPLLRKAIIFLSGLHAKDASAVAGLLNCISHAEELSLHMKESKVITPNTPNPLPVPYLISMRPLLLFIKNIFLFFFLRYVFHPIN